MPRIPTYTAPPPQLSLWDIRGGRQADPQDMGGGVAAAAEGLGRGVQQTGNQLIGMQENDEQRKAIVASSEIRTRYAKQLMDAATNGADIDKIKTDMNDELSKVGDGFLTKRGVDTLAVTSSNDNL